MFTIVMDSEGTFAILMPSPALNPISELKKRCCDGLRPYKKAANEVSPSVTKMS